MIFAVIGLAVLPCLLVYLTVPAWREVYSVGPASSLAIVVLFGLDWGVGATLFGLGVSRVGMALAFATVLGLTSTLGSLLPLPVQAPAELATTCGLLLGISLLLVVGGIVQLASAGSRRDHERRGRGRSAEPGVFRKCMFICIASGLLSPMPNFSFVFGKPVRDAAVVFGSQPDLDANAIWAPALAGGFLCSSLYPLYLLFKKKTWGNYASSGVSVLCFLGAAVMGLLWYGGISLYGVGATMMGPLGGMLGWLVFMSMNIIAAIAGQGA